MAKTTHKNTNKQEAQEQNQTTYNNIATRLQHLANCEQQILSLQKLHTHKYNKLYTMSMRLKIHSKNSPSIYFGS